MQSFDAPFEAININLRATDKHAARQSHGPMYEGKLTTAKLPDADTEAEADRSCKPRLTLARMGQDFYMFLLLLLEVLLLLTFAMRRRHAHISIAVAVLVCTQVPFLSAKWHRPPLHVHMFFVCVCDK